LQKIQKAQIDDNQKNKEHSREACPLKMGKDLKLQNDPSFDTSSFALVGSFTENLTNLKIRMEMNYLSRSRIYQT